MKNKEKQVEALKVLEPEKKNKLNSTERLFLKEMRNGDEIKKLENKIKWKHLKYESNMSTIFIQKVIDFYLLLKIWVKIVIKI